ncbi:helix-turn-helix domain-containing protein [Actinokineospora pegani]|uniref:helix-turn-helix domain-containing protein n=1 Tax=Actinokineospora pegani TaxID=2654637 RepID=UPI0012EA158D|nr:helix-turn-helix domain-containing protein [Actinokineospora pegani]
MSRSKDRTGLTVREAAWVLGVPAGVVHRAVRVGVLRVRRRRVPVVEVVRLLGGAA